MRLFSLFLGSLVCLTGSAAADDLGDLNCVGSDPDWVLELLANQAQFRFAEATLDFDIPQSVMSEGDKGPRALTLLGDTETAIVILEAEICRIEGQEHSSKCKS